MDNAQLTMDNGQGTIDNSQLSIVNSPLVPPGYKQTEVGVIPEDWGVKQIGDFNPFVTSGSRGWAAFYSNHGVPFIRITNLSKSSIYLDIKDLRLVSLPRNDTEATRTQLQDGDILISITADIGIIGYISAKIPKPAYINQHIALVRFDPLQINPKFVSYFLASEKPREFFRALTDSGAKAGMNLITVQQVRVILPPTLAEQEAIAAALSDADALIEALEQLIAKKRQLKQGAMQELLTGKRRLPGFSGEWVANSFEDVFIRLNSKNHQIQTSDYNKIGVYPVVDQGKEKVVGYSDRDDKVFQCPQEGVVIFGDHTCIIKFVNFDFIVGADGTQILTTKTGHCTHFHAFQLEHSGILPTGYNRHFKFLKERLFLTPTLPEQTAIAAILSDMDAEIAALEAKLVKARQVKQGMMQELLTGRTRLIDNG